jgi:hypothetical protein
MDLGSYETAHGFSPKFPAEGCGYPLEGGADYKAFTCPLLNIYVRARGP